MKIRRSLNLIRRRLALVMVALLIGGALGFAVCSHTTDYRGTATIYVGSLNDQGTNSGSGLNEMVATFAAMILQPVIAQQAIDRTRSSRSAAAVVAATTATVVRGTTLINVSVTDTDATEALKLTNATAMTFVDQVTRTKSTGSTVPTSASGAVPSEPAHVFQTAVSAARVSPDILVDILLGAAFGLALSLVLILALEYMDITIKGPEELEQQVGLPVLGIVPRFGTLGLGTDRSTPLGRFSRGGTNG
jgi:capsular polysaccharide biosynthesis protein